MAMSKSNARQAWTKFVEEREREAKRPRAKKRAKEEVSQAELEAGLDDLVAETDRRGAKTVRGNLAAANRRMIYRPSCGHYVASERRGCGSWLLSFRFRQGR